MELLHRWVFRWMNDLQYSNAYGTNEMSITDATSRGYNASSEYLDRGGNSPFIFHFFFLMGKGLVCIWIWNEKLKLFYYSDYFCYYLWVSLHFLILFRGLIVLFQLTFTFIYSTFSNKFSVSAE